MGAAYKLKASDVGDLLRVASRWHRKQVAELVHAMIRKASGDFRYFDESGAEISLSEIHRRSQADAAVQRSIYNLWFLTRDERKTIAAKMLREIAWPVNG